MVRSFLLSAIAQIGFVMTTPAAAQDVDNDLLIIAHRGASGERPEHTLAAYERAIDQGADYIEPDLVATKDGVLVSRHENEISGTTDVADHPEFADRKTTKTIDGHEIEGWFVEDFTIAELRILRAKERLAFLRPENTQFDGLYDIPTFDEVIALVKAKEAELGRSIGLYPEIKHPDFLLREEGIDLVGLLVPALEKAGYTKASDPIFVQCFEVGPLKRLDALTDVRLVQLIHPVGAPADAPQTPYAAMVTPEGLKEIASYADGIGPFIGYVLEDDGSTTSLVEQAHGEGLKIHPWTLRRENEFMPEALKSNDNPRGVGGLPPLMGMLVAAGVDGIFTDHPGAAVMLRESGNYEP